MSIPPTLLLLVHLHILEYPHANNPEYDHALFDSRTRGLRDRLRSMEDICYFLVGKIEGVNGRKSVFTTYPCVTPADTTAFRTSLARYLEGLRHHALYPSKTGTSSSAGSTGWWWREVVVRKSLLEECVGDKLLLALSTHALFKGTSSFHIPENTSHTHLSTQPVLYTTLLNECQNKKVIWIERAAGLGRRRDYVRELCQHINNKDAPSRYNSLSTERLCALSAQRYNDLLHGSWVGPFGERALIFARTLAKKKLGGMVYPSHGPPEQYSNHEDNKQRHNHIQRPVPPVPPLPVAAAHHPSHLRRMRRGPFDTSQRGTNNKSKKKRVIGETEDSPLSRDKKGSTLHETLDDDLSNERTHELRDALAIARRRGEDCKNEMAKNKKVGKQKGFVLGLWRVDFDEDFLFSSELARDNDSFHSSLSLFSSLPTVPNAKSDEVPSTTGESTSSNISSRIEYIRRHLLPSYHPIQEPNGGHEATVQINESEIEEPKSSVDNQIKKQVNTHTQEKSRIKPKSKLKPLSRSESHTLKNVKAEVQPLKIATTSKIPPTQIRRYKPSGSKVPQTEVVVTPKKSPEEEKKVQMKRVGSVRRSLALIRESGVRFGFGDGNFKKNDSFADFDQEDEVSRLVDCTWDTSLSGSEGTGGTEDDEDGAGPSTPIASIKKLTFGLPGGMESISKIGKHQGQSRSKSRSRSPTKTLINRIHTAGTPKAVIRLNLPDPQMQVQPQPNQQETPRMQSRESYPYALPESGVSLPTFEGIGYEVGGDEFESRDENNKGVLFGDSDANVRTQNRGRKDDGPEDDEEWSGDGPSMNLRDMLLDAGSTYFDLLGTQGELQEHDGDSSFEWE